MNPETRGILPKPGPALLRYLAWVLAIPALQLGLRAGTVFLGPVADATLIEASPTNSLGGAVFFNAGTTQNYTRNHALLRFDPAAAIPSGATVTRATLTLNLTRRPRDGFHQSVMGLFPMLRSWGEGTTPPKLPDTSPGTGGPAAMGDATWTHRFFGTDLAWDAPGGAPGIDFVETASSSTIFYGLEDSPYTLESTASLVADVQRWLDQPGSNFGWMLKPIGEDLNFTARQFASRESDGGPTLVIEFTDPPAAPSLTVFRRADGSLEVSFHAESRQSYRIESSPRLTAPDWKTLAVVPASPEPVDRSIPVTPDAIGAFLRLALE